MRNINMMREKVPPLVSEPKMSVNPTNIQRATFFGSKNIHFVLQDRGQTPMNGSFPSSRFGQNSPKVSGTAPKN